MTQKQCNKETESGDRCTCWVESGDTCPDADKHNVCSHTHHKMVIGWITSKPFRVGWNGARWVLCP